MLRVCHASRMTNKAPREFVLWGSGLVSEPIKITGGTLRECRAAMRSREGESWTDLGIYAKGASPVAMRIRAGLIECKHCTNVAANLIEQGPESMAPCSECAA